MSTIAPITGIIVMRSGATCMARLVGNQGTLITQASLSAAVYTINDLTTGLQVLAETSLVVANVIFNSLQQNDPRWDKDSQANPGRDGRWGYNFLAVIPAVNFANPDKFQIDVEFTPVTGEEFVVPFIATAIKTFV